MEGKFVVEESNNNWAKGSENEEMSYISWSVIGG